MYLFANSLNNTAFQQFWSRRMQMKHNKSDVFRAIANFEEQKVLKQGDTVHRPYRSTVIVQAYTRGTAVTIQDLTNTDETLVVNQAEVAPFYIDDLDQLQSNYKFINEFADDAAVKLGNWIDGDVLGEYANASSLIDDQAINGASGVANNGVTLNSGNIQQLFAAAQAKLGRQSLNKGLFAVISPDVKQQLVNYLAGKNSNLGDSTGLNGNIGKYYGFDLYESNNLTWTATLVINTQPNDGDTVVFKQFDEVGTKQTATCTFKTVLGSTAGNVLIGGSADAARTNLAGLLNAPTAGVSTKSVPFSNSVANILMHITATNDAATKITIVAKGQSFLQVSTNLTASATDGFTAALQIQHCLFGVKGATDLVIQKNPNVEIKEVQDKLGKNVLPWTLYGFKTFTEGKAKLVDVLVRTDAYVL